LFLHYHTKHIVILIDQAFADVVFYSI